MINYFVKINSVVPVLAESESEAKLKAVNEFMKLIVNDTADYAVKDSSKDSANDYKELYLHLSYDDVKCTHKCLLDLVDSFRALNNSVNSLRVLTNILSR